MIKSRGKIVFLGFIMLFTAAVMRLSFLMLSGGTTGAAAAQGSYTLTVDCPRGTIYGRSLEHISNGERVYIAALTATPEVTAALYEHFDRDSAEKIVELLRSGRPVTAKVPAGFSANGATVFACYERSPEYQPAVQLVGYLDFAMEKGVCGLQNVFDGQLSTLTPTTVTYQCDATGGVLLGVDPEIQLDMSQYERGILTTLDLDIQTLCEQSLENAGRGAVVVTRTGSGEILAMASSPGFSPSDLEAALESSDSPFINRSLSCFSLGSVFKLCVAAAALESGISSDRTYTCTGSISCGNTFSCHKKEGHGTIDMRSALAGSCNTYFIDLALEVGADKIYETATRLGLGSENLICGEISGAAGGLGDIKELESVPSALANMAIGQGKVMVTPLQVSSLINTVANGGIYFSPRLIAGRVNESGQPEYDRAASGRRVLDAGVAETLKSMMIGVVSSGTGTLAAPESGVAGGKTATAETGRVDKNGSPVSNAWFAGFYEGEKEGYSISVLVEGGSSGSVSAAPVFKYICDGIAKKQTAPTS